MKKRIIAVLVLSLIVIVVVFNVNTFRKVSQTYPPAEPPTLNANVIVFYGQIQPAGKEIRISPQTSGIVQAVFVREGDAVKKGQILCILDDAVEKAEYQAALARAEYSRKMARLSADKLTRSETLFREKTITEADYIQAKLKKELDKADIDVRIKEAELAEAKLNQHRLEAPADGLVYKCDLQSGELFQPGDTNRMILGHQELELLCDLESLWIGHLNPTKTYLVFHAETGDPLGKGYFVSASRYLRPKEVQTENPQERLSTLYQEIILRFEPEQPGLPIGLPVMVKVAETG